MHDVEVLENSDEVKYVSPLSSSLTADVLILNESYVHSLKQSFQTREGRGQYYVFLQIKVFVRISCDRLILIFRIRSKLVWSSHVVKRNSVLVTQDSFISFKKFAILFSH